MGREVPWVIKDLDVCNRRVIGLIWEREGDFQKVKFLLCKT